jgi:hypothetical protein
MKKSFESASDLDGFDEISEENQEKLITAWKTGEVADEGMLKPVFCNHGVLILMINDRYTRYRS